MLIVGFFIDENMREMKKKGMKKENEKGRR